MRIQHNIMAMNSYRNYTQNTSALSKNLEKLSSGYKINRAGDDAAGLAISEKMRAQVTGLKTAQKNAKDGISLVQTAEGALTEVHSMLNRMVELADQSANGTYDNEVDRANLQKEFDALRTEIDRIADSSNFNGIKLLDGSLSAAGKDGTAGTVTADLSKIGLDIELSAKDVAAVKGKWTTSDIMPAASQASVAVGDSFTFELKFTDKDGNEQTITKTLLIKDKTSNAKFYLDDGTEDGLKLTADIGATASKVQRDKIVDAIAEALGKDDVFKANFKATTGSKGLIFEARVPGEGGAVVKDYGLTFHKKAAGTDTTYVRGLTETTKAKNATKSYDLAEAKTWDGKADTLKDAIFEINGKKFAFIAQGTTLTNDQLKMLNDAGVEHWVTASAAKPNNTDIKAMVEKIKKETGLDVKQGTMNGAAFTEGNTTAGHTVLVFDKGTSSTEGQKGNGLTLQIGDTAESFNQLTVSVNDMHAKALGLDKISIAGQPDAQAAVDVIKAAINSVSSTRGDLGATQNRLEHTMNNLSVMQENIQDAEANIRDVDVAEEMMSYTKNNILVQSAQAMLAQANQVPQGVLQLLQ